MKKAFKIFLIVLLLLIVAIYFFGTKVVTHYINAKSKEMTDAHIEMEDMSVNLFAGRVAFTNYKFGLTPNETILQGDELLLNFGLWDMINGDFTIDRIRLDKPVIELKKQRGTYNYEPVVEWYESLLTGSDTMTTISDAKYTIDEIEITNGILNYNDFDAKQHAKTPLNLNGRNIQWDEQTITLLLEIEDNNSQSIAIDVDYQFNDEKFTASVNCDEFNLGAYARSIFPFVPLTTFEGELSTDLQIEGSLKNYSAMEVEGALLIQDVSLADTTNQPLVEVGALEIDIRKLDILNSLFILNSLKLDKLYLRYDMYMTHNSLSSLFPSDNSTPPIPADTNNDEIDGFQLFGQYIKQAIGGFNAAKYEIVDMSVEDISVQFNDYTLPQPVSIDLTELHIPTANINSSSDTLFIQLKGDIGDDGSILADLKFTPPNGLSAMMQIEELDLQTLSPYVEYYFKHPIEDGTVNINTYLSVVSNYLQSNSEIIAEHLEIGKKMKEVEEGYDVPLRTAVKLLDDKNGNLYLQLPIEGDISDPQFKTGRVIWKSLKEVIFKTRKKGKR